MQRHLSIKPKEKESRTITYMDYLLLIHKKNNLENNLKKFDTLYEILYTYFTTEEIKNYESLNYFEK